MVADIKVANGRDLDQFCNDADHTLSQLREQFDHVNPDTIPSEAQREAFRMMRLLIGWAESFTGTLRYDVQCSHESCPEHDDYARRKVAAVKEVIAAFPNNA